MKRVFSTITLFIICLSSSWAQGSQPQKLSGTVIGSTYSIDYTDNTKSTTVNTCRAAFDDNLNTFFSAWDLSYAWAGLDLGEPHVITRVGWSPSRRKPIEIGEEQVILGVFEGANSPDFMDALPLYIVTERGTAGWTSYADVHCSKGFRYVRYVGPADSRCTVAELVFYGVKGEGDESSLCRLTNLPTVSVHTEKNVIPYDKVHQINAIITIISDKGKEVLTDTGTIRERGNGSRSFPKRPYRLKFDEKHRVLDAPAKAKKWTLIPNYSDKTLMRNMLAFELSRCMDMPYTPYSQPVDVLLNGEYKGCYLLCDQIDVRKNRVNIDEMTPEDSTGTALTGGYLIEIDNYATVETNWFRSKKGVPVTIHYPDDDEITQKQHDYIEGVYNAMEENWRKHLDLNTFLRHFAVGELSGNTDTYFSVYMYKYRNNDTLYTGPVWDFDLAFENDERTYPINDKTDYVFRSGGSLANSSLRSFISNIVVNDAAARQKLLQIWGEARGTSLTEEHLTAYIDSVETCLQQAQVLNFKRWPVMDILVQKNPVIWGDYTAEVQNVRRFLTERLAWMDNKLGYVSAPDGIAATMVSDNDGRQVYNLSGQSVGTDLQALQKGVYIVREGGRTRKVQVR
jgi:hypothetical protein